MGQWIDELFGLGFLLFALYHAWGWYRARRERRRATRHGVVALLSFALAAVDLMVAAAR